MTYYYVLAKNFKDYEKLRDSLASSKIQYSYLFSPDQVPTMKSSNIAILEDAWMHHRHDDILDALEDAGILDLNFNTNYTIKF